MEGDDRRDHIIVISVSGGRAKHNASLSKMGRDYALSNSGSKTRFCPTWVKSFLQINYFNKNIVIMHIPCTIHIPLYKKYKYIEILLFKVHFYHLFYIKINYILYIY